MAVFQMANLDPWVAKTERRMTAVARQATNDMLKDIEIVSGITRGGKFKRGTIPKDWGALAGSLQSSLNGSLRGQGETSFVGAIGAMQAGDVIQFSWGGDTAPYAMRIHYGFEDTDSLGRTYNQKGTFFRDDAAAKWQGYVKAATIRAKAEFP